MKTGFRCVHIYTLLSLQGSCFHHRESCYQCRESCYQCRDPVFIAGISLLVPCSPCVQNCSAVPGIQNKKKTWDIFQNSYFVFSESSQSQLWKAQVFFNDVKIKSKRCMSFFELFSKAELLQVGILFLIHLFAWENVLLKSWKSKKLGPPSIQFLKLIWLKWT